MVVGVVGEGGNRPAMSNGNRDATAGFTICRNELRLSGGFVIDLTDDWAGPCRLYLADLGAGVSSLEPRGGSATRRLGTRT
jgi:hypothetical protein